MSIRPEGGLARAPLYARVEGILTGRIADGTWPPGHMLPSEMDLAIELGVSQGTVRRALDALFRRHVVERRQGRGTFVAQHTSERALFHFFRLTDAQGRKATPTSRVLSLGRVRADAAIAQALRLRDGAPVIRIGRVRLLDGAARVVETICLPGERFAALRLPVGEEMEDELYVFYQRRHGISVARAEDALAAAAATAEEAALLGLAAGAPLLRVERIAYDLNGHPVEWRVSLVDTRGLRYRVALE